MQSSKRCRHSLFVPSILGLNDKVFRCWRRPGHSGLHWARGYVWKSEESL